LRISLFPRKAFFSKDEQQHIVTAVKAAELQTSGEVRVYVESRCRFVDPLDRAREVFAGLKMEDTAGRNAVLIYVAVKDRQLAVYGDQGIHEKVGDVFWQQTVNNMLTHLQKETYAEAICRMLHQVGEALKFHFPYDRATDINELPDDIVFGR
jgi:uncharacterized membrane protein